MKRITIAWFLTLLSPLYLLYIFTFPQDIDQPGFAEGVVLGMMFIVVLGLYVLGALFAIPLAIWAKARGFNRLIYVYYGLTFILLAYVLLSVFLKIK